MTYLNSLTRELLECSNEGRVLQMMFPNNEKWGVYAHEDWYGDLEHVEIMATNPQSAPKRTHVANIQKTEKGWEVNTQFNGDGEDEMWIFKTFSRFSNAARYVQEERFKIDKPIEIYK